MGVKGAASTVLYTMFENSFGRRRVFIAGYVFVVDCSIQLPEFHPLL